jgi:hypothetical protein
MFTDTGWLIDIWLTMLVVIGPAALLRARRPASAGQTWLGVLLLLPWLTVTFLREHAVLGFIPLGGTWHDVGAAMSSLHHTTANGVAPIHTTVAVRLALCALLGLIAALVDLLAVVGRHGALAGVPLLVVFTVSGAVPRHPVSWIWFVLTAIGFLILLALDSSDDLQRWGYFVARSRTSGRRGRRAMSGQRIAVTAIILALLVPVIIPSDSKNLLSRLFHDSGSGKGTSGFGADHNGAGGTAGIDPFAALHGELNRDNAVPLFSVKVSSNGDSVGAPGGTQPFYLRTNVLSSFQGDGWRPGPAGAPEPISGTQFASVPGVAFQPHVVQFSAQITVSGLRSNPPVFASPSAMYGIGTNTGWNPREMLLVGSTVDSGQVISEDVAQPDPTVAALRAAPDTNDPALADELKLPPIRAYVRNLTAGIVAKARTPYERARAISSFFADPANGFSYSLQTASGDSGDDLTDFLRNRIGYCQQYAASMAVMLRLAHVPSRVVLGYAHPVPDGSGTFSVTTFDAHAWVEAYFGGIGWVPFDPTPLAGISGGAANDLQWAPHRAAGANNDQPVRPHQSAAVPRDRQSATPGHRRVAAKSEPGVSLQAPLTALAVIVLLFAILSIPAAVRWRRRHARLARVRRGDTDALWAELADTTVDLGYVWSDARSPRQVARWLGSSSDAASQPLRAVTAAVERARYSPDRIGEEHADLVAELEKVRAGLGQRRSPRERMRARFWPASLSWSRVPVIGRWLPGDRDAARRH